MYMYVCHVCIILCMYVYECMYMVHVCMYICMYVCVCMLYIIYIPYA